MTSLGRPRSWRGVTLRALAALVVVSQAYLVAVAPIWYVPIGVLLVFHWGERAVRGESDA